MTLLTCSVSTRHKTTDQFKKKQSPASVLSGFLKGLGHAILDNFSTDQIVKQEI